MCYFPGNRQKRFLTSRANKSGKRACSVGGRSTPPLSDVHRLDCVFLSSTLCFLKIGDNVYYLEKTPQAIPSPLSLAGAARSRALGTVRVNLAAAEKIGALSSAPSASATTGAASSRLEGMGSAIESMSSAIETMNTRPELYIERAGLLAMMDDGGGGGGEGGGERIGGESGRDYGRAAASDFATALWFSHSRD